MSHRIWIQFTHKINDINLHDNQNIQNDLVNCMSQTRARAPITAREHQIFVITLVILVQQTWVIKTT